MSEAERQSLTRAERAEIRATQRRWTDLLARADAEFIKGKHTLARMEAEAFDDYWHLKQDLGVCAEVDCLNRSYSQYYCPDHRDEEDK